MKKPAKQVWIRLLSDVPFVESLPPSSGAKFRKIVKVLPDCRLVSLVRAPRAPTSCLVALGVTDLADLIRTAADAKSAVATADSLRAKESAYESELKNLRNRIRDLENELDASKELANDLQYNVDILAHNAKDPELIRHGNSKSPNAASGIALLQERGAVGLPLQGGLPGLGKRR